MKHRRLPLVVVVVMTLALGQRGCGGGDDEPNRAAATVQAQLIDPEERVQVATKVGPVSHEGSAEACIEEQLRQEL